MHRQPKLGLQSTSQDTHSRARKKAVEAPKRDLRDVHVGIFLVHDRRLGGVISDP